MAELDLGPIIEAAELAVYTEHHTRYCMCGLWPQDCRTWPGGAKQVLFSVNAHDVVNAAAPLIERAVREQAAGELIAWANSLDYTNNSSLRRLRRHAHQCAQRVAPKPTREEVLEALQRGDFVGCHLDDAGRAIPPGERT